MTDLRRRIEQIIETDPVIKKGLERRIINSRALARYLHDIGTLDSGPDAILGIIRRYPLANGEPPCLRQMFSECEISLRDKLAKLEVEYHQETMYQFAEFASNLKTARGKSLRLIVGMGSIRIIADQNALENLRQTLRPREEIEYSTHLTEITIHLPSTAQMTKGIVAKITAELALTDVNLAGLTDSFPEVIVLVPESDAPRALEALQRLLKEESVGPPHSSASPEIVTDAKEPMLERSGIHNQIDRRDIGR